MIQRTLHQAEREAKPYIFHDVEDKYAELSPLYISEQLGVRAAITCQFDAVPSLSVDRHLAYEVLKRGLDILGALFLIVVTAPLWLLTAIVIKLSDFGPVFYWHTRVGQGGKEFNCAKFRSMIVDAERLKAKLASQNKHDDQRTFKLEQDPRITRLGHWLRKLSIDELPQLWNVLNGEMSLVGPRAPIPEEVRMYNGRDRLRLSVKPGLTCIWQVSGRSNLPFPEQLRLDLLYIEKRNTRLDLKLLLLTVPAVFSGKGAC